MVLLKDSPNIISYESTLKIIEQMRNNICKINLQQNKGSGSGFFCKIPFPDKNSFLPVLITNNHIINKELLYKKDSKISIDIKEETDIRILDLNNRMKYTNEEYDITIIEITGQDKIYNFLELDDNIIYDIIFDKNKNMQYLDSTIYAIQYPEGRLSVSYGILDKIFIDKNYSFVHKCNTRFGSAGCPILDVYTNKVLGIHCSGNKQFNKGLFLNYPIKEFIKQYCNDYLLKNFNIKYKVNIKNDKVNKIDLRWKGLGDAGFEALCKIDFKELKELILYNNNISDIKPLIYAKFQNLEILDLSQNKITNIDALENVRFKGLKQLYLGFNNISDINVLERANFEKLEILYLNDNKIDKNKNSLIISNLKSKLNDFAI